MREGRRRSPLLANCRATADFEARERDVRCSHHYKISNLIVEGARERETHRFSGNSQEERKKKGKAERRRVVLVRMHRNRERELKRVCPK